MQVEDEVSVCGKIMFGGEEEKLWLRWRSVEEVKKGGSKEKGERENSFFVLFFIHSCFSPNQHYQALQHKIWMDIYTKISEA